jgi:hypothetical protein
MGVSICVLPNLDWASAILSPENFSQGVHEVTADESLVLFLGH